MNQSVSLLRPESTLLLVVDLQDRLLPAMHEGEACVQNARRLMDAAGVLAVPVLATEQYPAGLGHTCAGIAEALQAGQIVEKMRFSACVDEVLKRLEAAGRRDILLVGIEAHVCVQQTALDLLRRGFTPYVCADAVTSRRPLDREVALQRMRQAGAIVTTSESAAFELLNEAGTDAFKRILRIVK